MRNVVVWGLENITLFFLERCWREFNGELNIVAFIGEYTEGGGVIANNTPIRVGNFVSKFIYPDQLNSIDYDICFIASANYNQVMNEIINNHFIPPNKQIIPAFGYINYVLVKRFVEFCDENIEFKNQNIAIYEYVKKNGVQIYSYDWFKNAKTVPVEIHDDLDCEMKYAIYKGKRMYYPKNYSNEKIANSINFFMKEQMPQSPHCYMPNQEHRVFEGDVVVDGGAAEANFSLDIIDKAKKIYVYEGEAEWIPALRKTFQEYQDKVVIINKFLDFYVHKGYETIDNTVKEKEINFIKMDIEGYELKALYGAKEHIKNSNRLRCSICAYHNHEDADILSWYFKSLNFKCHVSEGKLFRTDESVWQSKVPDLRAGMVYAFKV